MNDVTPGWRYVATVAEGDRVMLDGVDPCRSSWHAPDEPSIVVAHPSWPSQRHQLRALASISPCAKLASCTPPSSVSS